MGGLRPDSRHSAAWASCVTTFPPGTVTFLFTDVDGSTKLLHELGQSGTPKRSTSNGACYEERSSASEPRRR
jgi:hypothetical protein